jgi:autonomous glycyl radical cofactor GrcA
LQRHIPVNELAREALEEAVEEEEEVAAIGLE